MPQAILHKADTRGLADHGWLKSYQTFSFSNYYNPDRIQFGVLRVLNDDIVDGGKGFGGHPHDNMEIISIPLQGELKHTDNMGTEAIIKAGEIQVMSAGTGVYHTEYNNSAESPVKFLQIWLFPNKRNVVPRYQQLRFAANNGHNKLQQILSPDPKDEGVWIHQDAWFHIGKLDSGTSIDYNLKRQGNGIYIFVINGDVEVNGQVLNTKDGYGVDDINKISIKALSNVEILIMEVPMNMN